MTDITDFIFLKRYFCLDNEYLSTFFTDNVQKHRTWTVFSQFCSQTLFANTVFLVFESQNFVHERQIINEWAKVKPPLLGRKEAACSPYYFWPGQDTQLVVSVKLQPRFASPSLYLGDWVRPSGSPEAASTREFFVLPGYLTPVICSLVKPFTDWDSPASCE